MKSTTKISRYLNSITQENLVTNRVIPDLNNSHEDVWRRLKRYAH